jgi:hypothetical protein
MKHATMKRAASYGIGHLQAIASDMGGSDYSREMRNDINLAIAMLRAAPDLIHYAPHLCGCIEAGDGTDETQARLMKSVAKLRAAIERGTDRKQGELLK